MRFGYVEVAYEPANGSPNPAQVLGRFPFPGPVTALTASTVQALHPYELANQLAEAAQKGRMFPGVIRVRTVGPRGKRSAGLSYHSMQPALPEIPEPAASRRARVRAYPARKRGVAR